jgi:hypothetical protein
MISDHFRTIAEEARRKIGAGETLSEHEQLVLLIMERQEEQGDVVTTGALRYRSMPTAQGAK